MHACKFTVCGNQLNNWVPSVTEAQLTYLDNALATNFSNVPPTYASLSYNVHKLCAVICGHNLLDNVMFTQKR